MDIDKELNELFDDPLLNVSYQEAKLFDIPAEMKRVIDRKRLQPDHYAQKKACEDFDLYKGMFAQVQKELSEGKRSLVRTSKTSDIFAGNFYVVAGELVYLAEINEEVKASNGMKNARTRCIYENGTESDILLQTLRTNVMADGYAITQTQERVDNIFNQQLTDEDKATGYVYVLRSLSPAPEIASVKNLFKIGFTINSVEERIANAVNEPTYLMAPVHIVETAQIVNMNSHIFETLVHQVFDAVQFQIKVYDKEGNLHIPSEWYVAPLEIIELVIKKIVDGSITQYTYNPEMQCLEKRIIKKTSVFNTEGLKILTLNIKEKYFKQILDGSKKIEYRELKQTTLNKYTYIDEADGKRYLKRYDAMRLYVGYHKDRDSALVQILDTKYDSDSGEVLYYLGTILEKIAKD